MNKRGCEDAASPPEKRTVKADIFRLWEDDPKAVLVHQCNCVTYRAAGLAKQVFGRMPEANDYIRSDISRVPGTVRVHKRRVANLYGQRYPGGPRAGDTDQLRLGWFEAALEQLATTLIEDNERTMVLFPHGIGCGLARGKWADYEGAIQRWADKHHTHLDVRICVHSADD